MTTDQLRDLLARHFDSYRRKHRERVAVQGPQPEIELETLEKLVSLHDQGRLRPEWNDLEFRSYVTEGQVPVEEGTPEYAALQRDHAAASIEYRRWVIGFDRQLADARWTASEGNGNADVVEGAKPSSTPNGPTLKELADAWFGFASSRWKGTTGTEREAHLAYLYELIPADTLASEITAKQAREVRDFLQRTPVNRNKLVATRDLPLREQVEVEGIKRLDYRTIMKQLGTYKALFAWAVEDGRLESDPFAKVTPPAAPKGLAKGESRVAFGGDQIRAMLRELLDDPHGFVRRDRYKWPALLGVYTGARLNELCQLEVRDVVQIEGIWCIDINDDGELKSVKTRASKRRVPVHSQLITAGFLDYVNRIAAEGHDRLFPDLTHHKKNGYGKVVGDWFNQRFLPALGINEKELVFHSFRHTMDTALQRADVSEPLVQSIIGHERGGVTQHYFGAGFSVEQRKQAIELFDPHTLPATFREG